MIRVSKKTGYGIAAGVIAVTAWFFLTERPLAVPVVSVEPMAAVRVYGLGTVEARVQSKIGFEVGPALIEVLVDSNDRDTKGQVLARLHPGEQQARVARANAGVAASQAGIQKALANVARAKAVLAQRSLANTRQQ